MKKTISLVLSLILAIQIFSISTIPTFAASSKSLTKDDFSFGGRVIDGTTNFIDWCHIWSDHPYAYYFYEDEDDDACSQANRGLSIGDNLSTWAKGKEGRSCADKRPVVIYNTYGQTKEQDISDLNYYTYLQLLLGKQQFNDEFSGLAPREMASNTDKKTVLTYNLVYEGKTYQKNFYCQYDHRTGMPQLILVTYTYAAQ